MISNCSISESGTANGVRGDQTQKEYYLKPWYDGGWDVVLRHPNSQIQQYICQNAIAAAQNDNIGYGQSDRNTFWEELIKAGYDASKISIPCNADCSSSSCAICKAAGFLSGDTSLQSIPLTTVRYMPNTFKNVGFQILQDTKYLRSKAYLIPGDILLNTQKHACIYVGEGNYESFSVSANYTSGVSSMFSSQFEEGDAVVREFCSLDQNLNRILSSSKMRLSVINYAPLIENIAEANGIYLSASEAYMSNVNVDTSQLDSLCKIVVDYFLNKGLNGAAACGIAANIFHESGFRTSAVGDHGTSFGICQWHNSRGTSMKSFVGSNWQNNLTGQLDYLWKELNSGYIATLNQLKTVLNTIEGCKSAADVFVRQFERPSNVDAKSIERQATAESYFNQLLISAYSPVTSEPDGNLRSYNGNILTLKKSIVVPTAVQYGLLANYTNYTYFFPKWSWRCRTIADIWAKKGRTSNKGIATIDGHYLIAMSSKFGSTGDLVVIHLTNGESFSAIFGDAKGVDAKSEWGHIVYNNLVDIIEWEAIGSTNSASKGVNIQLGSWNRVKVTSVDNYGSWLD